MLRIEGARGTNFTTVPPRGAALPAVSVLTTLEANNEKLKYSTIRKM